jgi:cytochrome c2
MQISRMLTVIAAVVVVWNTALPALYAEPPSGAIVGAGDDGRLLLGELKCVACHRPTDSLASLIPKQAPILAEAGLRITPQYLRAMLANPQHSKPGTPMPDVLHHLPDVERAETVDLLMHYLSSLGEPLDQHESGASAFQIERGKDLYHRVGCVACHEPFEPPPPLDENDPAAKIRRELREEAGDVDRPSIPLPDLAMKTTVEKLAAFLRDPQHVRPSGRMPTLGLNPGEANMIAAYLLREQFTDQEGGYGVGLDYAYYDGNFPRVPQFDTLTPRAEGDAKGVNLDEVRLRRGRRPESNFAVRFHGLINIPEDGRYEFAIRSDDGAVLNIDGRMVVDNDGIHAPQDKSGAVELKQGRHTIEVGFMQGGGGYELAVTWKPPRARRFEPIPEGLLLHSAKAMIPKGAVDFAVDASKAERGRELFGKLGCAACHETKRGEAPVAPSAAKALAELNAIAADGCLGERVAAGRPQYLLSDKQKAALTKAIDDAKQQPATESLTAVQLTAEQRLAQAMTTLNCGACHVRNKQGGPSLRRSDYFTTLTTVDLGEEGRLAPPLDLVGAKLTPQGFEAILAGGQRFREHMATRMPQFGRANVGHLPELFAAADAGKIPSHKPEFSSRLVDDGRQLVGKLGLGCINCHAWGQYKLQGADGLDLLSMPKRLDTGWFHTFLTDPQAIKPGTRMPTAWPNGKSFFPQIQGGDVDKQMDAIWAYLSVGEKGGIPNGLAPSDEFVLMPGDEPIVFRTFVNGVGAHAIAVGFRQRTHVAFDALRVRMALAWTGEFLSAQPAWDGRAGNYSRPSGNVIQFAPGSPFAVLESADSAWPEINMRAKAAPDGYQFVGYRYNDQRVPTFIYKCGDVTIHETPSTEYHQDAALVKRRFDISTLRRNLSKSLYLRVAVGKTIEQSGEAFVVDGKQRWRVTSMSKPIIRRSGDVQELLVPIEKFAQFNDVHSAWLEIELTW